MDIVIEHLTKRYRGHPAVDDLSFAARAGRVTGFVGPNGAGKTTTMRALVGLVRPDAGRITIGGRAPSELPIRSATVGALLDGMSGPPGRRVKTHLEIAAALAGAERERVPAMLDAVDLAGAGRKRLGELSLGMCQRLGLAAALLGEPSVLVLDEPFNGLDPAGIRWMRHVVRDAAGAGAAVLVSSHLLSEIVEVADDVVIIDRGRLLAAGPLAELGDLSSVFFSLTESESSCAP